MATARNRLPIVRARSACADAPAVVRRTPRWSVAAASTIRRGHHPCEFAAISFFLDKPDQAVRLGIRGEPG